MVLLLLLICTRIDAGLLSISGASQALPRLDFNCKFPFYKIVENKISKVEERNVLNIAFQVVFFLRKNIKIDLNTLDLAVENKGFEKFLIGTYLSVSENY